MSIWTIIESENAILFVEHKSAEYQSCDMINLMSDDYRNSPVQIPILECAGGYENCLRWDKNWTRGQR